MKFVCVKKET